MLKSTDYLTGSHVIVQFVSFGGGVQFVKRTTGLPGLVKSDDVYTSISEHLEMLLSNE